MWKGTNVSAFCVLQSAASLLERGKISNTVPVTSQTRAVHLNRCADCVLYFGCVCLLGEVRMKDA